MNNFGVVEPHLITMLEALVLKASLEISEDYEMPSEEFVSTASIEVLYDFEENISIAKLMVEVVDAKDEGNNSKFELLFSFLIENLSNLYQKVEADDYEVNENLTITLAAISYSTARGILMTRYQGTAFQKFILPVVQPSELLGD